MSNPFLRTAQRLHEAAGVVKYTQEQIDRLDLSALMRLTPSTIRDRAFSVRMLARHYETGSKDGFRRTYYKYPTYYNQIRMYTASSPAAGGSGSKHTSYIRFYGPPGPKTPVWVHCDCSYFTYYLETLLASKGSSSIGRRLFQFGRHHGCEGFGCSNRRNCEGEEVARCVVGVDFASLLISLGLGGVFSFDGRYKDLTKKNDR